MERILILSFLILSSNCFSQTQHEMHKKASGEYKIADDKLNEVYQKILQEYKPNLNFIDNLKKSQRLWIKFRDAELEMKYPEKNKQLEYGSIYPVCALSYLTKLTEKRTEKLKVWLNGIEEGDMCIGSVKTKIELNPNQYSKAYIQKDGTIWLPANIRRDHRIFGYQIKNVDSKKMILLSVFTKDVKNNPFNCKYGAYYDTNGMEDLKLKYLSTDKKFMKIAVIKKGTIIDTVFMERKWFEFDE